ncbi:MAG TPA: type 4a pilus biogenesis protein PilO [Dissulfurispiraceae bacterium]|nr:type 4a pilus biogenesis protein PilO [Dissulfurispiraceae bacterium]
MKLNLDLPNIDYDALSPVKRYLLLFLPGVLIISLALVIFLLPLLEQKEHLTKEIAQQELDIATANLKAASFDALVAEHARLTDRYKELQLQLPEEKEVSTLLRHVSEKGIESGLVINLWKPGTRTVHPSNEVYEIPVDVAMVGTYHNFGKFFAEVTRLGRIVNLSNISVKSATQSKGAGDLNVTFSALTYSIIPEAERKALQETAQKEAAKKK